MPSELQTPLDWTQVTVSVQIKLLYSSLGISANDVQLLTYYGFFCFSSSICRGVFCRCDIQAHISETKLQVMEISGLVQDCGNSRALALELLQSCTKPLRQSCWSCIYMLYMCNMQRCDKSEQESTPCSDHWFHSCSVSYHVHRDHWWIFVYQAVTLMSNKSEKDLCFLQSLKFKISEKREKQFWFVLLPVLWSTVPSYMLSKHKCSLRNSPPDRCPRRAKTASVQQNNCLCWSERPAISSGFWKFTFPKYCSKHVSKFKTV